MKTKKCCSNCQWFYEDELIMEDDYILIGFCENPENYKKIENKKCHIKVTREHKCNKFKNI